MSEKNKGEIIHIEFSKNNKNFCIYYINFDNPKQKYSLILEREEFRFIYRIIKNNLDLLQEDNNVRNN